MKSTPRSVEKARAQRVSTVVAEAHAALLHIKKWKFRSRLKFAWWLLCGRGPWGGA